MDLAPPKDKYNLIFLTLIVHGIGTLTAFNMFITAKSYFEDYKLKNTKEYSDNFMAYVGWASQIPNLFFGWFNVFVKMGGNLTTRIIWSLIMEVIIFVVTVILAMVDSTEWPEVFFWLTMVTVFILNAFNAIFQNSVYGVAARLPPSYTGAVVLGSNICGTLVVLLSWASKSFDNVRTSAIYYFIGGMFVLLICFDTYFALPLNRFYRYHDTLQQRTMRVNPALAATNPDASPGKEHTPYGLIVRQSWLQLYNVFITFFVSLTVFPSVCSNIKPIDKDFFLGDNYTLITCFLTFNMMAMIGNITASLWQFPGPRLLTLFTTSRLVFIPFFLLCNYLPLDRTLPVWVTNDWVYWVVSAILGWSSGHASSLGMMYVCGTVAPEHAATAGMIGAATLVTGIMSGLAVTRLCPVLVSLSLWRAA
ncbi:equilibrative nucleoside transporter 2 isoform X2 [Anticarsia gemmatalis]